MGSAFALPCFFKLSCDDEIRGVRTELLPQLLLSPLTCIVKKLCRKGGGSARRERFEEGGGGGEGEKEEDKNETMEEENYHAFRMCRLFSQ